MKKFLLIFAFSLAGCATTSVNSVMTKAQAFAWQVANAYETANTGGVLTQQIASTALTLTKSNPSTTQEVLIATSLADKVIAAGVAAHNAGATQTGVIAAQTTILSDPGVIATVAAKSGG